MDDFFVCVEDEEVVGVVGVFVFVFLEGGLIECCGLLVVEDVGDWGFV